MKAKNMEFLQPGRRGLPAGVRKHIREQKARIRRGFSDPSQRAQEVFKLYKKFGIDMATDTSGEKENAQETSSEKVAEEEGQKVQVRA